MQDIPFAVYHTHRAAAKYAGLLHQSPCHNAMGSQKIVHGIGIKFIQPFINLIGIFDFGNILWWSQDMLSVQHSSYLLQGKGILLDGQRPVDGSDTIAAPQRRIGRKRRYCR